MLAMMLTSHSKLTTDLNAVPKSLFTRLTTSKGVEFDNLGKSSYSFLSVWLQTSANRFFQTSNCR